MKQNYKALGLVYDLNDMRGAGLNAGGKREELAELFVVPPSDDLHTEKNHKRVVMSDEEKIYLSKLVKKHGDNYENMARDIKVISMGNGSHALPKLV